MQLLHTFPKNDHGRSISLLTGDPTPQPQGARPLKLVFPGIKAQRSNPLRIHKRAGVVLAPGSNFLSLNPPFQNDFLLYCMSYCHTVKNIEETNVAETWAIEPCDHSIVVFERHSLRRAPGRLL
jgi:hypothetical protein